MALEESTTDAQGTSAGDGLGDGDAVVVEGLRVSAICEPKRGLGEAGYTGDASVLLVQS